MTPREDGITRAEVRREALVTALAVVLVVLAGWMLARSVEPPEPTWRERAQRPHIGRPDVELLLRATRPVQVQDASQPSTSWR